MFLSRNEILATNDRKMIAIDVPEMGEGAQMMVRQMSGHGREVYEQWALRYKDQRAMDDKIDSQDLYALMAVLSCATEDGEPLFTLDDLPLVTRKGYLFLKRIFDAAWKLNLFDPDEVDKAADFLEPIPIIVSGSDSLLPSADAA